jgi:Protein of unknown function (DUF3617)
MPPVGIEAVLDGGGSMIRTAATTALILALGLAGGVIAAAKQQTVLATGSYEVEVRLELPHLEEWAVTKLATVCITDDEASRGLVVLSDNNPLATCPISNVRQDGEILSFDIRCEGRNAARASATFSLAPQQFRGRIAMVMGGKNMTMTETQVGRRIGACAVGP